MTSAAAQRATVSPVAVVRAIPAWAWLVAIVAVSAAVRYAFARRMVGPWIMVDELIYSELAKSFAETGAFAIRDAPAGGGYGVVYPILLSPAYALFDAVPTAYAAARAINSLAISLAAVPAYLIARRLLSPPSALAAAVLAVSVPSVLYAGTLMTENAFYPIFLTAVLALVRALERPSVSSTLLFVAAAGAAFLTRAQAAVLVPVLLTAPVVFVALSGGGARGLAAFRAVYGVALAAFVAVLAAGAAAGRTPLELLGVYRSASEQDYGLWSVARWFVYHVAELDLYVAVLPFAALLLLASVARGLGRRECAFLATTLATSFWLLLVVGAFATKHANPVRIEERNAFYVAPLFLIALLLWIERGLPRPPRRAILTAGAAALLPSLIPYASLVGVSAQSDTFSMLTLWYAHETLDVPLERLWLLAAAFGVLMSALFLSLPRAAAIALPTVVLGYFVAQVYPIETAPHGIRNASIGAHFQGSTHPDRNWIDAAVGSDADVAAIWSGSDVQTIWQNEFFNRSVGPVYSLVGSLPGGLPGDTIQLERSTGRYFTFAGRHVQADYVLAEAALELAGRRVAADREKGLVVLRAPPCTHDACAAGAGEVRATRLVTGLYDDLWSGAKVTYTRYRCAGGTLSARLESDPNLFRAPQTVRARVAGRVVARARVGPGRAATLRVPLRRGGAGSCKATFLVDRTAVPARVRNDSNDTRALGVRFVAFAYRP